MEWQLGIIVGTFTSPKPSSFSCARSGWDGGDFAIRRLKRKLKKTIQPDMTMGKGIRG